MEQVGRVARAYGVVVGGDYCELTAASKADKTLLNYESAIRRFTRWCSESGRDPLPAGTVTLREYIREMVRIGRRHSTIRAHVAALCTWHRLHGHRIDRGPLYDILRGAAIKALPPRKAKALPVVGLRQILAALDPARPADVRDGALLALTYAGALRASEACALNWHRDVGAREGTSGHIEIRPEGLLVVLSRSKTSRLAPQVVTVAADQWPATIEWLDRWVSLAGVQPGQRIFAPVGRGGNISAARLASAAVTHIVRRRVQANLISNGGMPELEAILESKHFSSHSLRRGFLQGSAKAGTAEGLLRQRARHKSAETTAGYVELEASWETDWGIRL